MRQAHSTSSFDELIRRAHSTSLFDKLIQRVHSTSLFNELIRPAYSTSSFDELIQRVPSTSSFDELIQRAHSTSLLDELIQPAHSTSSFDELIRRAFDELVESRILHNSLICVTLLEMCECRVLHIFWMRMRTGCVTWVQCRILRCIVVLRCIGCTRHSTSHTQFECECAYESECECTSDARSLTVCCGVARQCSATLPHCNTLQHTATHCNALPRTATHCNTLQHSTSYTHFECDCASDAPRQCSATYYHAVHQTPLIVSSRCHQRTPMPHTTMHPVSSAYYNVAHSNVSHDSAMYVIWLLHMCDNAHSTMHPMSSAY